MFRLIAVTFAVTFCPFTPHLIPTCTQRDHSKMGKIGHRVKNLRSVLKLSQLIANGVNHGIKGDKERFEKAFSRNSSQICSTGLSFRTIGRLWYQTNMLWNDEFVHFLFLPFSPIVPHSPGGLQCAFLLILQKKLVRLCPSLTVRFYR